MKNNLPPAAVGFIQATALTLYIAFVSYFFSIGPIFAYKESGSFFGPVIILLLFILSAVISALLVLGKAGMLFWEKKYKEAFEILGWTIIWGFIYFFLVLIVYMLV